jgi:hypothetical protein
MTGLLFPGTSLVPVVEHHHSDFKSQIVALHMMCDVPSTAIFFCGQSIEWCRGIVSRCFLNFYVQFPWPK